MSGGPYARAAGRGCGLALLQLVLVPVIFGLVFVLPIAIASVIPASPDVKLVIGGGGVIGMLIAFLVAVFVFVGMRTRALDRGFAQVGIAGSGWMPNLREYHGAIGGRTLDAIYARRGGVLEISIDARTATKVAIGSQAIAGAREVIGLSPLGSRPDLPGAVVSADDPGWADRLLSDPGARHAIASLLQDPSGRELRWVLVRPGCVKVTRRWIDPDAATATIPDQASALARLADACERTGAPARVLAPGGLEGAFRRSPTAVALVIVIGILTLLTVPVVAIAIAMMLASSR